MLHPSLVQANQLSLGDVVVSAELDHDLRREGLLAVATGGTWWGKHEEAQRTAEAP